MKHHSKNIFRLEILGMIFLTLTLFFLYYRSVLNLQTCGIFFLFGFVIILFTNEKKTESNSDRTKLSDIEMILIIVLLIIIAFIITTFIITNDIDFDVFITFILVELIMFQEFIKKAISPSLQIRLNILIYVVLILFLIVIIKRIIYLSILYLD